MSILDLFKLTSSLAANINYYQVEHIKPVFETLRNHHTDPTAFKAATCMEDDNLFEVLFNRALELNLFETDQTLIEEMYIKVKEVEFRKTWRAFSPTQSPTSRDPRCRQFHFLGTWGLIEFNEMYTTRQRIEELKSEMHRRYIKGV